MSIKLRVGLLLGILACGASAAATDDRALGHEARVRAEAAMAQVRHEHRGDARAFGTVVSRDAIEARVRNYLQQSVALEERWGVRIDVQRLAAELDRIHLESRMPDRLAQLLGVLEGDRVVALECLARPLLVDRLVRERFAFDAELHASARREATSLRGALAAGSLNPHQDHPRRTVLEWTSDAAPHGRDGAGRPPLRLASDALDRLRSRLRPDRVSPVVEERDGFFVEMLIGEDSKRLVVARYTVPKLAWDTWWADARASYPVSRFVAAEATGADRVSLPAAGRAAACTAELWTPTAAGGAPTARSDHAAVWTGAEMIVWGGRTPAYVASGGRYDPVTNSWTATSLVNAPSARGFHTAVWTGSEMIVWGGGASSGSFDTGGRYDPVSDSWTPTQTTNAPVARDTHSAVWAGTEMIVWGGYAFFLSAQDTGGRYDPVADAWTSTPITGAPSARASQAAVWTGDEMLIWGGLGGGFQNTGGLYDPELDSWRATSIVAAPAPRDGSAFVWTGDEFLVWGGYNGSYLADGGRYDPVADTWIATATAGAPSARIARPAVWTGNEMIVWAGADPSLLADGGSYRPATDGWAPVTTVGAPTARRGQVAVWSGSEMIVWGGNDGARSDTGGRYLLAVDGDADGFCTDDCDDNNGGVWSTPGEVTDVVFTDAETLAWTAPANPGGTGVAYDTLRSGDPADFTVATTCVETNDGADTMAFDLGTPGADAVFHYLLRARNACPAGDGTLGTGSGGLARNGRSCP